MSFQDMDTSKSSIMKSYGRFQDLINNRSDTLKEQTIL